VLGILPRDRFVYGGGKAVCGLKWGTTETEKTWRESHLLVIAKRGIGIILEFKNEMGEARGGRGGRGPFQPR